MIDEGLIYLLDVSEEQQKGIATLYNFQKGIGEAKKKKKFGIDFLQKLNQVDE